MSITSKRAFVLASALVAGVTGLNAAPAFAEDVRTMTVDYKDLNVHSATGQKVLAHRVSTAARQVCAIDGDGLQFKVAMNNCQAQAKDRANADLHKAGVPTT